MKSQVLKLYHLHKIRSISGTQTQHAIELLVHVLVISRLHHGNSLLYGLPDLLLDKLQIVQTAAARVVVKASRYDQLTPILDTPLWLPVRYRIQNKIILKPYKASHLLASSYLSAMVEHYQPSRTLQSPSESLLVVHRAHLRQFGDRAFCIAAPHLRNDLPCNMRTCGSFIQELFTYEH